MLARPGSPTEFEETKDEAYYLRRIEKSIAAQKAVTSSLGGSGSA